MANRREFVLSAPIRLARMVKQIALALTAQNALVYHPREADGV